MTKLGVQVPENTIIRIEKRAVRLASLVEVATQTSTVKAVRENGAQLIERLGEWVEEIKELRDMGDDDVHELIKSFGLRLAVAEEKVKAWQIPPALRAQLASGASARGKVKGRGRKPVPNAA